MSEAETVWIYRSTLGDIGRAHLPEELAINLLHLALWTARHVHDGLSNTVVLM